MLGFWLGGSSFPVYLLDILWENVAVKSVYIVQKAFYRLDKQFFAFFQHTFLRSSVVFQAAW